MTARRPRKKKTIIEEDVDERVPGGEDTSEFDIALESADDNETLKDVLEQFGQKDNVLYRIYKQTPNGPSFAYESPQFDEGFLQRERGAGAYTVRIFINGRFKKSMPVLVEPPLNGTAEPNGNGRRDSHSEFLEKLLMVLITNQAGNQNHGPSLTDMTSALANLDGLRGKQENVMDTFIKGITMGKDLASDAGNGDWKTELLKMGREAMPAIATVVNQKLNGGATAPATQPGQPGEEQPAMLDFAKLTPEQKRMMLGQAIQYLKQQCFGGLDPESALNFIVTNSGNPQYQIVIKEVLAIPFEELVKIDAEIGQEPFHVFFRTIYDGLRSEFGGEDTVDDDPGRDVGNDRNVRSNGGTS